MKIFLAILCFVAAGGVFIYMTEPMYSTVQAQQAQQAQYQEVLDKVTQFEALQNTLIAKRNAMDPNDIARLNVMVPTTLNNIALIMDLSHIAQTHALAIQNVAVATVPTGSTQSTNVGINDSSNAKYQSTTITFSVTSTYAQFEQFLLSIEQSLRLLDVQTISIAPASQDQTAVSTSAGAQLYTFTLTLKTYWFNS